MREFIQEEKDAIEIFFTEFNVKVSHTSIQSMSIDAFSGFAFYDDDSDYNPTEVLSIFYDEDLVHEIHFPKDDVDALVEYVMIWDKAGRPTPRDNTDFFTL